LPLLLVFVLFFLASSHHAQSTSSRLCTYFTFIINADQNSTKSTINQFIHQQHTTTANMRSSIFFVAPFVAAAYAQSSDANTTVRI
jgi:menaquinone-dependent protoporphyrinogen IX oxidase